MTLLDALALLFGGLSAFYFGVRALAARVWPPIIELEPEWEVRRGARLARTDDFRNRRDDSPTHP